MSKTVLVFVFLWVTTSFGIKDITGSYDFDSYQKIGKITQIKKNPRGVFLKTEDDSEVVISFLADDLVRVRASFQMALSAIDHSWAIAKTDWSLPKWQIAEDEKSLILSTLKTQVRIQKNPLKIEFRDAKTQAVLQSDGLPMLYNKKSGEIAAVKKLGLDEHFYGLGEKAANLDKRRGEFTMWNSDTPGYGLGTDPIYQSIPFYISLQKGRSYGVFFDNSYQTTFDFGHSTQEYSLFSAKGGEMNYYFFSSSTPKEILGRYTELTGRMPMPPIWALGNQQSRWSYYNEDVAQEIVKKYREADLPLDVLYLDIEYMNGFRVFTWDKNRFPNPSKLTANLAKQGVKVVTIVDPGVKYQPETDAVKASDTPELDPQEKNYYVYKQGNEKDYFLKRGKGGKTYIGRVWPGDSVFVDYTLDAANKWWGDLHRAYTDHGVAGIWNDMNEPADFYDQKGETQADVVSYDLGQYSPYAKNRNLFGLLMSRSTFEGLTRLQPKKRPFVITRAAYAGIQRYATMWTGDNQSNWESLRLTLPMFQSLGLSGQSFVGADIGGFMAGVWDPELMVRWYQVAFLTPLCRNHRARNGLDHEPFRFPEYYRGIIRKYLKLRYRFLPFLYTRLEESHRTGLPLFRPLILNFPTDPEVVSIDDEFMVGDDILVAPALKPHMTERKVYLPEGQWVDYWSNRTFQGKQFIDVKTPLETIPLFIRSGAVLPEGPVQMYVGEKKDAPIHFKVYPDSKGTASGTWYEDDGESLDYQNGSFHRVDISLDKTANGPRLTTKVSGNYKVPNRNLVFSINQKSLKGPVKLNGKPVPRTNGQKPSMGWSKSNDVLSIQIPDDGKSHIFSIQ